MYKLLKTSKENGKNVVVHVGKNETFKGRIVDLTPYYITIKKNDQKKNEKDKVFTSYRTKWVRKAKEKNH